MLNNERTLFASSLLIFLLLQLLLLLLILLFNPHLASTVWCEVSGLNRNLNFFSFSQDGANRSGEEERSEKRDVPKVKILSINSLRHEIMWPYGFLRTELPCVLWLLLLFLLSSLSSHFKVMFLVLLLELFLLFTSLLLALPFSSSLKIARNWLMTVVITYSKNVPGHE